MLPEGKRYAEEVKKDRNVCYLMLFCMADDIVCEFEKIKSAKVMWNAL